MSDTARATPIPTAPRNVARTWLALFVTAFALYAVTANRGAQWQDSGSHILRIVTGQVVNPLGLALSHPLHYWLGRLAIWPNLLQPCFAITLVSAVSAAAAVASVFGCVVTLTGRHRAALLAAASLGLANTFWSLATLTETYTLTAALLAGECWCVALFARHRRPRHIYLALLLNGLGISNHMLAVLTTPILAVVLALALRRRWVMGKGVLAAALLWLLGTLPFVALVVQELSSSGDLLATARSAFFGHAYAKDVLNVSVSVRSLGIVAAFFLLNFPNLLLPAAVLGIARSRHPSVPVIARRALLAALIVHACFALRYPVTDQHMFLLPTYVLLAIFAGVGFARMFEPPGARPHRLGTGIAAILLACTPVVYAVTPSIARNLDMLGAVEHHKPYRDDYRYLFVPWSVSEGSADRMSREAVDLAGERGLIVVEDPMAEFAVRYRAIQTNVPGVTITSEASRELLTAAIETDRPIVLVPLNRDAPRTELPSGDWGRVGDLYRSSAD